MGRTVSVGPAAPAPDCWLSKLIARPYAASLGLHKPARLGFVQPPVEQSSAEQSRARAAHAVRLSGPLDPRGRWQATACSVARALDVISSRSALLILREAFYGTTRFDDFAERAGISEPVAAARLRELVGAGLLEREDYRDPGQRTRQGYRLTEKGADLFPALAALMQRGSRGLDDRGGP